MVEQGVDNLIRPLTQITAFDADSLSRVVDVHARLVEIIRLVTRRKEQSFCSKYLSVPFPNVVPRFDSKAKDQSHELVGNLINEDRFAGAMNEEYAQHCQRVLALLGELRNGGVADPELPLLDHLLWKEGGGFA